MNITPEKIKEKAQSVYHEKQTTPPFLNIFSSVDNGIFLPQTECPYLYVVLSGTISLNFPDEHLVYNRGDYFLSNILTPLKGTVIKTSPDEFSALSVDFYPDEIISVLLEMESKRTKKGRNIF